MPNFGFTPRNSYFVKYRRKEMIVSESSANIRKCELKSHETR